MCYECCPFVKTIGANPSQIREGSLMRVLGNDNEQVIVVPCPSSSLMSLSGESCVEMMKRITSSSCLNAREVVVVAYMLRQLKKTTSSSRLNAREEVWWQMVEIVEETTSSSYLDAREVVTVAEVVKTTKKNTSSSHLNVREVAVVAEGLKCRKKPPPTHVWMRGRQCGAGTSKQPKKPPPARIWT